MPDEPDFAAVRLPAWIEVGPGVILRSMTDADAPELFAACERGRDALAPWLPWIETTDSPAVSLGFIRSEAARDSRAIVVDGVISGVASIVAHDRATGRIEVGYWLEPRVQGQGIVTRAVRAIFRSGEYHALDLLIDPENVASLAVARRLGLVDTGERVERHRQSLLRWSGVPTDKAPE